jgi:hypothetical protein
VETAAAAGAAATMMMTMVTAATVMTLMATMKITLAAEETEINFYPGKKRSYAEYRDNR